MTLLTHIFLLLIGAGVLDFALTRYVRLQESVYRITLIAVWFLFTIRYYYGADIYNYVPVYEHLHPWYWYLQNPDHYEFEHGFVLFCAMLKGVGLSYYWMTAIVTTFYFVVIGLLFSKIKRHKVLALMTLVIFDYNLIFAAHRQCLAVTFFILMVLALDKRQYIWAAILAIICSEMHKSGIFIAGLTWVVYVLHHHRMERMFFLSLMALLALMLVIPMTAVNTSFVSSLPLPESFVRALTEHLSLGRRIQVVWLMYALVLVCIEYYVQNRNELGKRGTEAVVIMGLVLMVLLYQYFYLLVRLRSYFLPLLLVYLFRLVQDAEDANGVIVRGGMVLKELCCIFAFVYFGYVIYRFEQNANRMFERAYTPGKKTIYSTSTVFDLRHRSARDIQAERMLIAKYYWWYDYKKGENNTIK